MTESERDMMVWDISKLISQGFGRKSLHKIIEERYNLTSVSARNKYISQAAEKISEGLQKDTIKELMVNRLESISEKAEDAGKYTDAIKAIESQGKLLGLFVDKKEVKLDTTEFTISFE